VKVAAKMTAKVLPTYTPALFDAAVTQAAELLRAGELVALPTETVYGLAANALDERAVARIFEVKGRPSGNPIIVHVASAAMAHRCAADWPTLADRLAKGFWPGPLTLVLPRSRAIPDIVTAGGATVGIRWPSHPFIQAVIRACGFPLAAPSANVSGQISPTNAQHVLKGLGDRIRLIIDGGQSQVGIESTVLDLTTAPPHVLRPGMIHAESLSAVSGELPTAEHGTWNAELPRSPGLLRKHYAPKAKLLILSWRDDAHLHRQLATRNLQPATTHVIAHTCIPSGTRFVRVSVIPHDAEAFARAIYAELHRCDEEGAGAIIVEAPPDSPDWRALKDRLRRAAA
jgi:L-threonylcarbamoyladenylate synthase